MAEENEIIDALAAPFHHSRISWRIGSTNAKFLGVEPKDATKGKALAYLTARDVMHRLDSVMGVANWSDAYQETPKRLLCSLSLRIDDEWIVKTDGAGNTDIEGEKGGISDAFKRAAVKWGVGRYLYDCPAPWIDLENGKLPKSFNGNEYLPSPNAFKSKQMKTKVWNALKDAAAEDDSLKARETWDEITSDQQKDVWSELSSGQRSTLKKLLAETKDED